MGQDGQDTWEDELELPTDGGGDDSGGGSGSTSASIRFGNPSADCTGNGICTIAAQPFNDNNPNPWIPATLTLNQSYATAFPYAKNLNNMDTVMAIQMSVSDLMPLNAYNSDLYNTLVGGSELIPDPDNIKTVDLIEPLIVSTLLPDDSQYSRVSIPPNSGPWPILNSATMGGGVTLNVVVVYVTVKLSLQ